MSVQPISKYQITDKRCNEGNKKKVFAKKFLAILNFFVRNINYTLYLIHITNQVQNPINNLGARNRNLSI